MDAEVIRGPAPPGKSGISTVKNLLSAHLPQSRKALLLLRHSIPISKTAEMKSSDLTVYLTEQGRIESKELGEFLKSLRPDLKQGVLIHSSYIRCKQTLQSLVEGIGYDQADISPNGILKATLRTSQDYPEMANPEFRHQFANRGLHVNGIGKFDDWFPKISKYLESTFKAQQDGTLSVLVSHHSLTLLTACGILGIRASDETCPNYLEGILFYTNDTGATCAVYRDVMTTGLWP